MVCVLESETRVMKALREFIGPAQMRVLAMNCRGEEGEWFRNRLAEIAELITKMPKTYETDGEGDKAVAHLHYFTSGWDFYITEKDTNPGQHQAFGLVAGFEIELGSISIPELLGCGAEIDLYWEPKTIGAVRAELANR